MEKHNLICFEIWPETNFAPISEPIAGGALWTLHQTEAILENVLWAVPLQSLEKHCAALVSAAPRVSNKDVYAWMVGMALIIIIKHRRDHLNIDPLDDLRSGNVYACLKLRLIDDDSNAGVSIIFEPNSDIDAKIKERKTPTE